MIISLIVAMGQSRQIGKENQLLWHISEDLKNFKKITLGHHMLMGRKTFESIGKALPGRKTIILSRNVNYSADSCTTVTSFKEALDLAELAGEEELFICGGAEIYNQLIGFAHKFYISYVDYNGDADAYFPDYSQLSLDIIEEKFYQKTEKSSGWTYKVLERKI